MRTVFIVDEPWPPSAEALTAQAASGAAELLCGIPDALAALGIDTFGYHEIEDAPPMPLRVSKIDFSRLFTTAELVQQNVLRKQIAALAPADYADPAKAGLVGLEIVLQKLDLLANYVELDHADTIAAVGLLETLGVLTAERAAQVLAGAFPA